MKRIFTLLFCLLAAASATSGHTAERQGEACSTTHAADSSIRPAKKSVTQRREVRRFEEIAASSGITILVRQADEWTVEVSADKNIIDRVQTEVVGKTLRIRYRNNTSINGRHEPTVVRVSCPVLTNISATSGTDITFTNLFEGEALTVMPRRRTYRRGHPYGDHASATSGADITLTGRSRHSTLTATSGANIDASALVSEEVSASATSGAHVKTYAHTRLTAKATSGAIVVYYGNPTQTDISATSGGSIRKRP
ncbi:MAG: head GIN domain-containing protein [Alistipes inops]